MNNMNASVADDPERLEQHSLRRSVILHLLPGALIGYLLYQGKGGIAPFRIVLETPSAHS